MNDQLRDRIAKIKQKAIQKGKTENTQSLGSSDVLSTNPNLTNFGDAKTIASGSVIKANAGKAQSVALNLENSMMKENSNSL